MDAAKVDQVLQYALAVASEADDELGRRLGKIHLLKYVYLADLAHAEKHGAGFTGAAWRFDHYGPSNDDVWSRIEPAVQELGAHELAWSSTIYEDDSVRWSLDDEDEAIALIRALDRSLPVQVTLATRRAVREFGSDTSSLLHHVYTTAPMLHAAPLQVLDLAIAKVTREHGAEEKAPEPTVKEMKRRREAALKLNDRFQAAIAAPRSPGRKPPAIEPLHDDVFVDGARWIDALAGVSPEGLKGEATLSEDVWTSEVRRRGRLP